jgi:hypothetical protein
MLEVRYVTERDLEGELAPFERPMASRRVLGATPTSASVRPVRLWSFDEHSLPRLVSFLHDGLFHWPVGPDGWFEDLTVYRAGELVFGVVSHDREGTLRLTPEEHAELARLDIPSSPTAEWIDY